MPNGISEIDDATNSDVDASTKRKNNVALEALEMLRDNYYDPQKAEGMSKWKERVVDPKLSDTRSQNQEIESMAKSFKDPWTEFVSAEQRARNISEFQSGVRSAGVWVRIRDSKVQVSAILHGHSAHESSIRAGDTILSVNGNSVRGKSEEQIENMMSGKIGDAIQIRYRDNNGVAKTASFKIDEIKNEDSSARTIETNHKKVLYSHLPRFDKHAIIDFDNAIDAELKKHSGKIDSMILDMRGNPGGFITSAHYFESEFLKGGIAFKQVERKGAGQIEINRPVNPTLENNASSADLARLKFLRTVPLVVLIDDSSRSAAETVTAGLRDRGRTCAVVGERSFGKGVVYNDYNVGDGNLRISTSMVKSPNGTNWHGKGLEPDIRVPRPRTANAPDVQLQSALRKLTSDKCKK